MAEHELNDANVHAVGEASIQRAVGPLLKARGYELDVAGTGAEALRAFADRPQDLIILDLGLPDMEGTEGCRRIRAESAVPIVVLSARGAESDKVNALDLGAATTSPSPLDPRNCWHGFAWRCVASSQQTTARRPTQGRGSDHRL